MPCIGALRIGGQWAGAPKVWILKGGSREVSLRSSRLSVNAPHVVMYNLVIHATYCCIQRWIDNVGFFFLLMYAGQPVQPLDYRRCIGVIHLEAKCVCANATLSYLDVLGTPPKCSIPYISAFSTCSASILNTLVANSFLTRIPTCSG